jgi:hypothetical protein
MNKEERVELLASVEVGDLIRMTVRIYRGTHNAESKVKRITKTLIVLDNGSRFKKADGVEYGGSTYFHKHIDFNNLKDLKCTK